MRGLRRVVDVTCGRARHARLESFLGSAAPRGRVRASPIPLLALGLLLPLSVLPGSVASQPREPYSFDVAFSAPPRVGETVEMTVTLHAHVALGPMRLRLETPDWVHVEDDAPWSVEAAEGGSRSHAWRLRVAREGFWHAGLSFSPREDQPRGFPVDPNAERMPLHGCCAYAYSAEGEAIVAPQPHALPLAPPRANVSWSLRALDGERVEVALLLTPLEPWMRHADFQVQDPSREDGVERQSADAARRFARVVPLRPGNETVLTFVHGVAIAFDAGPTNASEPGHGRSIGCANLRVGRVDDNVSLLGETTCYAMGGAYPGGGSRFDLPMPGLALVAPALVGVALGLRGLRTRGLGARGLRREGPRRTRGRRRAAARRRRA